MEKDFFSNLLGVIQVAQQLISLMFLALAVPAFGSDRGYQYQADADRPVQLDEARRIIESGGGHFVGPMELSAIASVPVRGISPQAPFTARELLDCPRPCALVLSVSSFGDRGAATTIKELVRAPEFRSRINSGDSRITAWFLSEDFAARPLREGWHLMSLRIRDKGISYDRRFATSAETPMDAVTAVWLMALVPPQVFTGQSFYTSDSLRNGDMVVVGRSQDGDLQIDRRLRAIGDPQVGHLYETARLTGGVQSPAPATEGPRRQRLREKVEGKR